MNSFDGNVHLPIESSWALFAESSLGTSPDLTRSFGVPLESQRLTLTPADIILPTGYFFAADADDVVGKGEDEIVFVDQDEGVEAWQAEAFPIMSEEIMESLMPRMA